jgi:hypothetical protein
MPGFPVHLFLYYISYYFFGFSTLNIDIRLANWKTIGLLETWIKNSNNRTIKFPTQLLVANSQQISLLIPKHWFRLPGQ